MNKFTNPQISPDRFRVVVKKLRDSNCFLLFANSENDFVEANDADGFDVVSLAILDDRIEGDESVIVTVQTNLACPRRLNALRMIDEVVLLTNITSAASTAH